MPRSYLGMALVFAVAMALGAGMAAAVSSALTLSSSESEEQTVSGEGVMVNGRPPIGSSSVVLLGDSLTEQGPWDELLADYDIRNQGYSSSVTAQLVPIAAQIVQGRPQAVTILLGTNDVALGVAIDDSRAQLLAILDLFAEQSPETAILLHTLPPRADRVFETATYNQMLREVAQARGLQLLDLYPLLDNGFGSLRLGETADGIHLERSAYLIWSAELRLAFDRMGVDRAGSSS